MESVTALHRTALPVTYTHSLQSNDVVCCTVFTHAYRVITVAKEPGLESLLLTLFFSTGLESYSHFQQDVVTQHLTANTNCFAGDLWKA